MKKPPCCCCNDIDHEHCPGCGDPDPADRDLAVFRDGRWFCREKCYEEAQGGRTWTHVV
jgi:hypothetical protein